MTGKRCPKGTDSHLPTVVTTQTPDVSFHQYFGSFEPVYYQLDHDEPDYASHSTSIKKGYWVGFADNVGDTFTLENPY